MSESDKKKGAGGKSDGKAVKRVRPDKRLQLLIYMKPDVVKDLKRAAMDEGRNAYEIVEKLVQAWLKERGKK